MSEVKLVSLNPSGITVLPDRMRRLRPEVVDELADSITAQGLLQPIVVRPKPKGGLGYYLVAGWHRLMAVRKLKHDSIRAIVLNGLLASEALLTEIDENLIRADLSPAEQAMHIDKRKELYETDHGKAKAIGGSASQRKQGHKANEKFSSAFTTVTAKKIGKTTRIVQINAKRGEEGRSWLSKVARTSLDKGDEIDALRKLPTKERNALIKRAMAGETVSAKTKVKQVRREQREKELGAKQLALPDKKYGLIVCDDAWDFEVWSEKGKDRHAANHYVVEDAHTAEELHKATKDRFECAADDCVLAMWATVPHLAIAIDLLRRRGFRYVSNYTWGKNKAGTGYWNRNKHETLLLGVRGDIPCPAPGKQWDSLQMAPVGKHSAKPELFLQMLEEYFPNLPKIELMRRGKPRPGWDAWGNEVKAEAAE